MEISNILNFTALEKKIQPDIHIKEKGRQAATNAGGSDKVEFSNQGKTFSELHSLINSVPDVREFRVKEVISAIEQNTYNVSAEQIAEKIIEYNLTDKTD